VIQMPGRVKTESESLVSAGYWADGVRRHMYGMVKTDLENRNQKTDLENRNGKQKND